MSERSIRQIIAALNEGQDDSAFVEGDLGYTIIAPAPLGEAGPAHISFYGGTKQKPILEKTKAGCILIGAESINEAREYYLGNKIIVSNVPLSWAKVLNLWAQDFSEEPWGIDPRSLVARTAKLGKLVSVGALSVIEERSVVRNNTKIYPQCYIGKDVTIGENCIIYPQVVIRERCKIGNRVIIHSGSVIGADGFGFVTAGHEHRKVPQIGHVEIGDDVEIGANVTIDRAQAGATRIGSGTKIDNLVQVAHNVQVGEGCLFAAQVGIAGSARIGKRVILGGQAGVRDHVEVADGTIAGGQTGIIGDVREKDILWGTPARNHREIMKLEALLSRLPEMYEYIKKEKSLNSNHESAGKKTTKPKNF